MPSRGAPSRGDPATGAGAMRPGEGVAPTSAWGAAREVETGPRSDPADEDPRAGWRGAAIVRDVAGTRWPARGIARVAATMP